MTLLDNRLDTLTPITLREYAQTRGWKLVQSALASKLFVLNSPEYGRQVTLPMDANAPDFADAAKLFLEKISGLEQISETTLLDRIRTLGEDTLRIKIPRTGRNEGELPFTYAQELLAGAKQIIMASACSVVNPQVQHPRLSRTEAQQMADKASLGHTEQGSFVLRISCPIDSVDYSPSEGRGQTGYSFVRLALVNVLKASCQLVSAVDAGTLDDFIEEQKRSPAPILSANLCEGISRLYDDRLSGPVVVSVDWSPKERIAGDELPCEVRIPKEYFSRISEAGSELRRLTALVPNRFIGTVEELEGEMGDDGRRLGDVIVSLLLGEGETVRAKLTLSASHYKSAVDAHLSKGAYVQITGILHPGRQPRRLTDISTFSIISS
jgi:hypothetical protein